MSKKCDMIIDVEWDAECDEEARCPSERWVIPHDAYNDADGETADLNEVISSYLSQETSWLVAGWTFIEYRTAQ
jgi:hypothetical protein